MSANIEHMWLPATALACYEGDAQLRSWLIEPGLLTARMRSAVGERFRIEVVSEAHSGGELVREIALCDGKRPWIFAETRVPQSTARRHPWLLSLGASGLGESLQARGGSRRTDLEFGRLPADSPIVQRATGCAGVPAQALWVRRSKFLLEDESLLVQEVFLPQVGRSS